MPNGHDRDHIDRLESEIARLTEERRLAMKAAAMMVEALSTANVLLAQLMTEMRLANVTPSAGVVVSKAAYDQAMRQLLGSDREKPPIS